MLSKITFDEALWPELRTSVEDAFAFQKHLRTAALIVETLASRFVLCTLLQDKGSSSGVEAGRWTRRHVFRELFLK